jgi:murein DD-endopeptidase MepM/ murein hydrolase activator NlpD
MMSSFNTRRVFLLLLLLTGMVGFGCAMADWIPLKITPIPPVTPLAGTPKALTKPTITQSVSDGVTAPLVAQQGNTLQLRFMQPLESPPLITASGLGKTIRLFPDIDKGMVLGLLPVSVRQPPGTYTLTFADNTGRALFSTPVRITDAHFPKQNISVSKATKGLEPLPGEMEAIAVLKNTVTGTRFWQEPFVSPTPDCKNGLFGMLRYHNGVYSGNYHKGVDLRSPLGRPVRAITGGIVQIATMYRLHGGTVGLNHGQGLSSIYIHLSRIAVKPGQMVQAGDPIGFVGATGFATGPHLHWGLYANGLPVNPDQWVNKVPSCY